CAATALTGVIQGGEWFGHILVAVLLIGCTGLALRSLRAPALAVGFAQLVVLTFLVTGLYTSHGILGIIPGPAALAELNAVLTQAGEQIRVSLPPVDGKAGILCLATIGIGLVAVVVDTLAVSLAAPAAAGLVLLCLYAVPASLADEMLPWWSFTLGAAAFAALIAVDGNHRHRQWRSGGSRNPASGMPERSPGAVSLPMAVVGAALSLGLLAGATFTAIGTVGQLPFVEEGESSAFTGGLGLQPLTKLQGLLNDQGTTEVFRVEGLGGEERLLRAFTLDTYEANVGWRIQDDEMPHGVAANQPLPRADGDNGKSARNIRINPMNWNDVWLPTFGHPRELRGVDNRWIYDEISGAVYTERARRPSSYQMTTSLEQPSAKQLRKAPLDADGVAPIYTELPPLDPRVRALTDDLVEGKSGPFDKARAIWAHFIESGQFTYDTETDDAGDSDALTHFLLKGRRGFCAQFASAMAVMVRSEGIPARVAVGFTPGTQKGNYRSITTRDAHAWVEVYLGEKFGWVVFDPTPLAGGRGFNPDYLNQQEQNRQDRPRPNAGPSESASAGASTPSTPEGVEPGQPGQAAEQETSLAQAPGWARWSTLLVVLLAAAATTFGVIVARRT
ncbi:MAG: transglutaminaseTgpA domain-containing protein, partial [Thermocrispum sp.]